MLRMCHSFTEYKVSFALKLVRTLASYRAMRCMRHLIRFTMMSSTVIH